MAYEKHTWQCGETVTAELLNHMEDGIAEGGGGSEPLIVRVTYDDTSGTYIMDKTFGEIRTAVTNGQPVVVIDDHTSESGTQLAIGCVTGVDYNISPDSMGGQVYAVQSFSVDSVEPPYTLEALDALYPYYSS